eukprot:763005-Hanusia_phi.AAC.1
MVCPRFQDNKKAPAAAARRSVRRGRDSARRSDSSELRFTLCGTTRDRTRVRSDDHESGPGRAAGGAAARRTAGAGNSVTCDPDRAGPVKPLARPGGSDCAADDRTPGSPPESRRAGPAATTDS